MDYTSRMAALLGRFRRERNGVVADTMQYRGKAYGLNYGVSLPTIRAVARAERPDSDFARFLYRQDVRELKLATFWIADPVQVTSVEFSDWGEGIANSEMAEECAFALMSRSPRGDEWGRAWCDTGNELLGYAGLLALSRIPHPDFSSLVPVLRRLVVTYPESNLVAQGVVVAFYIAEHSMDNETAKRPPYNGGTSKYSSLRSGREKRPVTSRRR